MVRKSGQNARAANAKAQPAGASGASTKRQASATKRAARSSASSGAPALSSQTQWPQQLGLNAGLTPQGLTMMSPVAFPIGLLPSDACGMPTPSMLMGWPCDLHTALQRMGVLPCLPSTLPEPFKSQQGREPVTQLVHLNSFLDESYALQQRGHQLWVAEQYELQRGADLAIISPPNPSEPQPEPAPASTPVKASQQPGLVSGEEPQPARSPTDVLMSPQMLAGVPPGGVLSSPVAGSAGVQLLSPTACGLHPLLLQELPHSTRRRLLSPHAGVAGNAFLVDEHEQGGDGIDMGDVDLGEDTDLLPPRALMYPDFHIHHHTHHHHHHHPVPKMERPDVHVGLGPLNIAPHHMQQHHAAGSQLPGHAKGSMRSQHGGTPTRLQSGMLGGTVLEHVGSPLSPADLLTYPSAAGAHGTCMDMGLIGAYACGPTMPMPAQLESDIHAELRFEAGLKRKH